MCMCLFLIDSSQVFIPVSSVLMWSVAMITVSLMLLSLPCFWDLIVKHIDLISAHKSPC